MFSELLEHVPRHPKKARQRWTSIEPLLLIDGIRRRAPAAGLCQLLNQERVNSASHGQQNRYDPGGNLPFPGCGVLAPLAALNPIAPNHFIDRWFAARCIKHVSLVLWFWASGVPFPASRMFFCLYRLTERALRGAPGAAQILAGRPARRLPDRCQPLGAASRMNAHFFFG